MYRLIWFIPIWILVFLVMLIPHVLGFILIPLACLFKAYTKTSDNIEKPDDGATYKFTWFFMWPWDNNTSDGIACRNYYTSPFKKYSYLDMLFTVFVWSAVRNPINNLKRLLSPKYDFDKLSYEGAPRGYGYKSSVPCWYLIGQGPFGGFYWSFNLLGKHRYILMGYKLRPQYSKESDIPESQKNGVGMTFRIIPKDL